MSVQSKYPNALADQRRFFDELITRDWDSYHSEAWDFSRRFEVARLLRSIRPRTVLDVGCGCGFHDVAFASYDFVDHVDGIDYSVESIKKANEAYPHPKVSRRVADLERDRFDAVYDLVVSFQVIEHLVDPDPYFAFALAAVKPGGTIAVVTPNVNRIDNRIRRWRGEPPAMLDPQHFHEYSLAELRALGERHGLVFRESFAYGLQSLIKPGLTPKDYRRATIWGAWVPPVANVIAVLFTKPAAGGRK